jgi:SAM-dependent methyltransferase
MTGQDVHPKVVAYTQAADNYVRGRPDYPAEMPGWLRGELAIGPGANVLDLGAGTGKFTKSLVETGARVIAVEPIAEMRRKLASLLPGVEAHAGTAGAIPLPDGSLDAVVCAQAFHWFATAEALAEIHRVLKPGGRLGLIWNVRDERVPWVERLGLIINRHQGDAPRYHSGAWRLAFPHPGFGALEAWRFSHAHVGKPEDVIFARVRSTSFIAALPKDAQREVDDEVRALVANEPALAGKAEVSVPYVTEAFRAIRL